MTCLSAGSTQAQCNPTQGTKVRTTGPLTNNHERYCGLWNSYHIGCLSRTIKSKVPKTGKTTVMCKSSLEHVCNNENEYLYKLINSFNISLYNYFWDQQH